MKKIIIKIITLIVVTIIIYNLYLNYDFSNIAQIEYHGTHSTSALGGIPYSISIDKEGKVTLSNTETSEKYRYEITYRSDEELYKQLIKIVKNKRFAFFEPVISDYGINDGNGYTIIITTNLDNKYEKGGYEPKNKKLKRIRNCIFEYIKSNGNETTLTAFYRKIDEIDLQKSEDMYKNKPYKIIENT